MACPAASGPHRIPRAAVATLLREREVRGARTVERGVGEDGFLLLPLLAFLLLLLLLIRAIIRRALIKPESIMLAGYFRRWPFSAVLH